MVDGRVGVEGVPPTEGPAAGVVETPIRVRQVVGTDGVRRSLSVYCERSASSVPLDSCKSCERFVTCTEPSAGATPRLTCRMQDGVPSLEEVALPEVRSTMLLEVVCASPRTPIVEVLAVLPAFADIVPVVSEDGRLLGIFHAQRPLRGPMATLLPVGERMIAASTTLEEATPLNVALRAMAIARQRQLVVVQGDQHVVSVLRDVDAMLCLARR